MRKIKVLAQGSSGGDHLSITIRDESSRVPIICLTLKKEELASVLLLQEACADAEVADIKDYKNIGTIKEHKTENVEIKCKTSYAITEEEMKDSVAPFEVDGWTASFHTIGNHHYRVANKKDTYKVHFYRFINKDSK